MKTRQDRRRLIHLLMGINGAGFVLCGTFLSGAAKEGYIPWLGIAGVTFMFFGVVVPFYREFVQLRTSFESVEREAKMAIKRRRGDLIGEQEILPAKPRSGPFIKIRDQPIFAIAITLIGWTLIALEGLHHLGVA